MSHLEAGEYRGKVRGCVRACVKEKEIGRGPWKANSVCFCIYLLGCAAGAWVTDELRESVWHTSTHTLYYCSSLTHTPRRKPTHTHVRTQKTVGIKHQKSRKCANSYILEDVYFWFHLKQTSKMQPNEHFIIWNKMKVKWNRLQCHYTSEWKVTRIYKQLQGTPSHEHSYTEGQNHNNKQTKKCYVLKLILCKRYLSHG